ncbi:sugar phosphate isomerase/epimerase family protein [Spirosoma sp. KNUC1025]|uniref:sugar phosphate isomerase/epimerase family protein n=1 Tax=Spirosoma sp. KNUC1025 TaxID=2894082 RepID=UPI00386B843F|nr:sugar phosphate isomerase/epimerase [Spirosoma sp. KNUC1025]
MKSCVTIALVPAIRTGPWIYWDDLEVSMAKAIDLGFDAVELFTPAADTISASRLIELTSRFNLGVAAVGTGAGKVLHGLTLTDPDPQIRARAVAFIAAMISFGATVGAPAIIGSMQGNVAPGVAKAQALQWLADGLITLGEQAEQQGVGLIYEPLNRYETNLINDLKTGVDFLRSLPTKRVALLADLFHMNLEERSLPESIRAAGSYIGHVHFADSNRRAMGLGHTAMDEVAAALREIGYTGYISAEAFPYPDSDQAAQQTIQSFKTYFR